jgi:hypothetical protein
MIRRSFLLPTKFDIFLNLQTAKTFGIKARQGRKPGDFQQINWPGSAMGQTPDPR